MTTATATCAPETIVARCRDGRTVQVPRRYSDGEAVTRLTEAIKAGTMCNGFARSLVESNQRYGSLTANQLPWVHVLLHEAEEVPNPQVEPLRLPRLAGAMTAAAQSLKCPTLQLNTEAGPLVLKMTGRRSRNPGWVAVKSAAAYGAGQFYGWLLPDGTLQARNLDDARLAVLQALEADFAETIAHQGLLHGECCCCGAELSQVQSRMAGYGATCARHWGLPYPKAAQTRAAVAEHPELLIGASDAARWQPRV